MNVSVCVITYRRPEGLERLLRALDGLVFQRVEAPGLEVVVVDNDPDGSAAEVCERVAPDLRWPIRYERETRRGLSYARNHAVAAARDRADFIAFIDDDEAPDPRWLDELLAVQAERDADVVSGPVLRVFEGEVPEWVVKGGFFVKPRYETGARVEDPATANVLVRTAALEGMEQPFDERFALTGGEDTHLFLRLARDGRRMVWADGAVVREWIPASRTTAAWVLQRVYRTANTWSMCERELRPTAGTVAMRAAKGAARIGYGVALLPFSWLLGRHMVVRSLWYVCFGAGNLTGLAGLRFQEYRVTHGR